MAFLSKNWFMRDMGYISTIHYGAGESCDSSTENKRTVNEHPASPRNWYHSPIYDDSWFYESKWRIQLWLFINPPLDSTTQTVLNLYHLALIATFLDMALISMKANCHLSSDPTANEQLWYRKLGIRVLLPGREGFGPERGPERSQIQPKTFLSKAHYWLELEEPGSLRRPL